MMETKRILRRMTDGETGKCYCGLRAAYAVQISFQSHNRYGLAVAASQLRRLCSTHGRRYAAKWKLEVQE